MADVIDFAASQNADAAEAFANSAGSGMDWVITLRVGASARLEPVPPKARMS
ncbi:hypothetical protein [Mesorhizobium delmotii]|uniref:Uncharacterized protein n=1 Tax=Mesorhizobium delmotii TaxID=1631247 RepID=A0A2P9ANY6_9HYPH|nr:hypothetical protein [Mesorhizobium delmotii]SJM32868.1 hypothetical protein BQ8482_330003 [Mesorhizobium delmotii]